VTHITTITLPMSQFLYASNTNAGKINPFKLRWSKGLM